MLGRTWIAEIEKTIPIIPTRQPSCLTIIEGKEIIGFAILKPKNKKGTCWEIKLSDLIKDLNQINKKQIYQSVLKRAINLKNDQAHSWVVKCEVVNIDQISIARELGFQPLKLYKSWRRNDNGKDSQDNSIDLPEDFEWQHMKDINVSFIWSLVKAGESQHLRQILDRNYGDLLLEKAKGCGMMVQKSRRDSAIISIIGASDSMPHQTLEIVRGTSWDGRIKYLLPWILHQLNTNYLSLSLESSSEDNHLNECLISNGWVLEDEKMLLGRTLWKRQSSKGIIKGAKSIESMIERLQPQSPPLPTPTQGRSYKNV